MIRVPKPKEPDAFDDRCRKRGRQWLKDNPAYERPRDYWSEFEPDLRAAFSKLCGYCAMFVMKAQVDHFTPVAALKAIGEDRLAYEWTNFRYGEGILNQRKSSGTVLDPYKVRNEWFKILLPSLQMVLTPQVPRYRRKLAEFTLTQLGLRDSEVVVRYRETWFRLYRERKLTLDGLKEMAPLIATAVEMDLEIGRDWRV